MRLKRRIFGVFAAALAGVLLCGCTAAEGMHEHRTETPITIKVGSDNYPPFNYTDENGNPAGVDVDLAKESFGRLGYAVSFVGIDWEEKKKLVEHGDIDCIWGCFSIDGRMNAVEICPREAFFLKHVQQTDRASFRPNHAEIAITLPLSRAGIVMTRTACGSFCAASCRAISV